MEFRRKHFSAFVSGWKRSLRTALGRTEEEEIHVAHTLNRGSGLNITHSAAWVALRTGRVMFPAITKHQMTKEEMTHHDVIYGCAV